MPLTKTNTGNAIRGIIVPNAGQRRSCQAAMTQVNFADLGRGAGTLHISGGARLDMQGRTADGSANLQVQIGGGTIAAALVAPSVLRTMNAANQVGIANGVISVLNQSMDSGTVWRLDGTLP